MKMNAKVYVVQAPDGKVKIGVSNLPSRRRGEIDKDAKLIYETGPLARAERVEQLAHRVMALHGKHLRGEWFEAEPEDAIKAIEIAIKQDDGEELALGGSPKIRGRPKGKFLPDQATVIMRLPPSMIEDIDEIGRPSGAISRSAVIRELLREALDARKAKP